MSGSAPGPPGGAGAAARETAWETLRRRSRVYPPEPPGRPGVCAVCRGPAGPGYTRCYQCARHEALGPDLKIDWSLSSSSDTHVGSLYSDRIPPCPAAGCVVINPLGVPEPATWAMMILGMGMVGMGLRLRRRSSDPLAV